MFMKIEDDNYVMKLTMTRNIAFIVDYDFKIC